MKKWIVAASVLVAVAIATFAFIWLRIPDLEPKVKVVAVHSEKYNDTLYIKMMIWGVTWDHRIILVSESPDKSQDVFFHPDINREYIIKGWTRFFYRLECDTLQLYVDYRSDIPALFDSRIVVRQNVLTGSEMFDLSTNYEARGLKTVEW